MTQIARVPRWFGPVAGFTAAAVALGVAELVAVFTGARSAPLVAVGGVVVDSVPKSVKDFAVSTFGTHDKTALLTGTAVLLAAFALGVGALAVRDLRLGLAGIGVFAAVGVVSAATRPDAGPGDILPSLLGALAGGAAMVLLLHRRGITTDPTGRRRFLAESGGALAGAAVVGLIGRQIAERQNVSMARAAVALPVPASPAPAVPAQAGLTVPGSTSFVTPNAQFYRIDTALSVPQVDPQTWRLRIHGRVRNPMTLSFADLLARPAIERYVTLACVSNEVGGNLIGNARWLGVPLKSLLEEAGPMDGADQVVGRAVDGFTVGAPTAVLMDGRDAMLAFGMNGQPLPIEHGFPVRMVVPGLYGYVSATKWLAELELTRFGDYSAYWVPRGWSRRAPIKTESRIDTPRPGSTPMRGRVTVAGVAWAQHRGISKVEVRVDDGPWQPAALSAVLSVDTWRLWSWAWDATAGEHQLRVRATDNAGDTQTEEEAPPDPDGATGWHTINVTVS